MPILYEPLMYEPLSVERHSCMSHSRMHVECSAVGQEVVPPPSQAEHRARSCVGMQCLCVVCCVLCLCARMWACAADL